MLWSAPTAAWEYCSEECRALRPPRWSSSAAGVVGSHAAHIAMGMGADTWVIDRSAEALKALWRQFGERLDTVYSTRTAIDRHVTDADVVIGGVLIPGAAAPKLVTADMIRRMKPGSVVVDVAIDQGGCIETSRPTTHSDPTFIVDGVVHYCVANMPGAVPRTATFALNNVTLPHVVALADKGYRRALLDDPHLRNGLNVHAGDVTCEAVATALGCPLSRPVGSPGRSPQCRCTHGPNERAKPERQSRGRPTMTRWAIGANATMLASGRRAR